MVPTLIKDLLSTKPEGQKVTVCGWVRTVRDSKNLVFIQVNDGSCFANIQLTFDRNAPSNNANVNNIEEELKKLNTGASVRAEGVLIESPASGQAVEVTLESLKCLGTCNPDEYPLQKNKMSMEYLRTNAHLRARTNTFGAVYRVRNQMAFAVHSFFQERGFQYINAPEITCSDCEGAGEMFQVTTLSMEKIAEIALEKGAKGMKVEDAAKLVDYSKDFFGKKASLTVSGQLEAETMATALSRVYTFGPTFRAENSNTQRHAAEFWMIEPEIAFADLQDDMDLAEGMVKYIINYVLEHAPEEMAFFDQFVSKGVLERVKAVAASDFKRLPYTEAIEILLQADKKFENPVSWGIDLSTEHERYLTDEVFKAPVFVTDYPKDIKAFYMRLNDDQKTVAAMDLLVPGVGELIGGSQREERLEILEQRMDEIGVPKEELDWYLDLRRYGGVKHAGFGLGFERMIMYITGVENIRDVVPFPRTPKNAEF